MKDSGYWLDVCTGWIGCAIGVTAGSTWLNCAKDTKGIEVSPETRISSRETTTTGEAEGMMGPFYAAPYSAPKMTQTTIGTISLGSGWLWVPVGLLVMVALRGNITARWRGLAVERCVEAISELGVGGIIAWPEEFPNEKNARCGCQRWLKGWVKEQGPDTAERVINKAVRRLKKGKR